MLYKVGQADVTGEFTYGQKIQEIFLDCTQGGGKHISGIHSFALGLADSNQSLNGTGHARLQSPFQRLNFSGETA